MAARNTGPVRSSEPSAGVRLVTLSLPKLRNAMTAELTAAWTDAIADIQSDPEVRAVVITGEGPVFCAGADLSWLGQLDADDRGADHLRERMLPFYRGRQRAHDRRGHRACALLRPAVRRAFGDLPRVVHPGRNARRDGGPLADRRGGRPVASTRDGVHRP
jgi:hypothetical protein